MFVLGGTSIWAKSACAIHDISDIDECTVLSVDCLNGGTCADQIASYACECVQGYAGPLCNTSKIIIGHYFFLLYFGLK